MSSLRKAALISLSLIASISLASCAPGDDPDGPTVVATNSILGDIVSKVVGDEAEVVVLIPLGADPHEFQPSARDVASINGADLVVANGLGLEAGLGDVLDSAESDGVPVLRVAEEVDPIPFGPGGDSNSLDPHFWTDPLRVGAAASVIAVRLESGLPGGPWQANADGYIAEMTQLDAQIEDILSPIPDDDRNLVTNHDAMSYFAARYGFDVIGTVIPGGSTLADPSSAELAELATTAL